MPTTTLIELDLSLEVAATTEVTEEYIPPSGAEVWVEVFRGDAAFSTNAAVKLYWDIDGVNDLVWSTKGSKDTLLDKKIVASADGVKKIALALDNGEAGALFMSGYARIKVIT